MAEGSSSSSSHKDNLAFQNSSCDVTDGTGHESSDHSSSNSINRIILDSAGGHFDLHQNQREKENEDDEDRRGHRTILGKSSESVLLIDEPPGGGNHELKAQLGALNGLILCRKLISFIALHSLALSCLY